MGVVYVVVVARRMRKQSAYRPVLEDWLFHVVLPLGAYAILAASAFAALYYGRPALFLVGVAALMLLLIGIHNAWDAVTYQVFFPSKAGRVACALGLGFRVDGRSAWNALCAPDTRSCEATHVTDDPAESSRTTRMPARFRGCNLLQRIRHHSSPRANSHDVPLPFWF